jgi:hypothetical protein
MTDPISLTPDPAKMVPTAYVGPLDPNYFCRAWNGKRFKYCRCRAGFRTSHVGVGRCWVHGGGQDQTVTTGRYCRTAPAILGSQLLARLEQREYIRGADVARIVAAMGAAVIAAAKPKRTRAVISVAWDRLELD